MYIPGKFFEDKNIATKYTYFFSRERSPLSIAIKFTPLQAAEAREKMIANYFATGGSDDTALCREEELFYRESVTSGKTLSIYSLRFALESVDGVLFGCFNCPADIRDEWRAPVLEMLRTIAPEESTPA
ncbi:hypothetical protein LJC63_07255 [Ruminococcaceae bacterium OttesenSCG-928-L11]|nr:hypothetical protein [Ruminococcaceae bacterium OttesenSCG-928-L11]